MSYLFRCVFSGPCAYVPNKTTDDPTPIEQVKSWSVVLPALQKPLQLTVNDAPIPPHYAMLQYQIDQFDTNFEPDMFFRRRRADPELGLVLLDGARIRIRPTDPRPLLPNFTPITNREPTVQPVEAERRSLDWLPQLEKLLTKAGKLGRSDQRQFRPVTGLPFAGAIAGHVLIKEGDLVTHTLNHEEGTATAPPGIWGFRVPPSGAESPRQAVAHAVALELTALTQSVTIELVDVTRTRTLQLRQIPADDSTVGIEIKNREFDEIVRFADSEISRGDVDRDFKSLYGLSGTHTLACPLPFLFRDQGLGTRRTTCSGGAFAGFDPGLFGSTLPIWESVP